MAIKPLYFRLLYLLRSKGFTNLRMFVIIGYMREFKKKEEISKKTEWNRKNRDKWYTYVKQSRARRRDSVNEYYREYNKDPEHKLKRKILNSKRLYNPIKQKEVNDRYRSTHKEDHNRRAREWYKTHADEHKKRSKLWRERNRDKINAMRRERRRKLKEMADAASANIQ